MLNYCTWKLILQDNFVLRMLSKEKNRCITMIGCRLAANITVTLATFLGNDEEQKP